MMTNKKNKTPWIYRLITILILILTIAFSILIKTIESPHKANAAAPQNVEISSNILSGISGVTSYKTLVATGGHYRSQATQLIYTDNTGKQITINIRDKCNNGTYRQAPWPNRGDEVSSTSGKTDSFANYFYSDAGGECLNRFTNQSRGYWHGPWGIGTTAGFALPGETFEGKTDWIVPYKTQGTDVHSLKFSSSDPSPIWKNTTRETIDAEPYIHTNDLYPNAYLLSSGIGYFRVEFNLTKEQIDFVKNNPENASLRIWSRADDFQKVWINGYSNQNLENPQTGTGTINEAIDQTFTGSQMLDINSLGLKEGLNVVAFQVYDKARWSLVKPSDSNAAGLSFKINLNFWENPSCNFEQQSYTVLRGNSVNLVYSTQNAISANIDNSVGVVPIGTNLSKTVTPISSTIYTMQVVNSHGNTNTCQTIVYVTDALSCAVIPQTGLAPLVVRVDITGGMGPYSVDMGDGNVLTNRNSPVYYTYSNPGPKIITVKDTSSPQQTCIVDVTVTNPTSPGGGEVAP